MVGAAEKIICVLNILPLLGFQKAMPGHAKRQHGRNFFFFLRRNVLQTAKASKLNLIRYVKSSVPTCIIHV